YYSDLRDLHSFPTRRSSDLSCNGVFVPTPPPPAVGPCEPAPHPRSLCRSSHPTRSQYRSTHPDCPGDGSPCTQNSGHPAGACVRSEEHTSELQSRGHLVCRL